jgi:hypothetical protein
LLIKQPRAPSRPGLPPEAKRIEILLGLLKLKRFEGIWYNGRTIGVRQFATGEPEYLSWEDALRILEPQRKPPASATGGNGGIPLVGTGGKTR